MLAACGAVPPATSTDGATSDDATAAPASEATGEDAGVASTSDGSSSGGGTIPPEEVPDGDPTRIPCTDNFGDGLSSTHGRLDGVLVAIVSPGAQQCSGDDDHLHLQVLASGQTYDVALNVRSIFGDPDVRLLTQAAPLTGKPWAEGWNPGVGLDYLADLGVRATDFTPYPIDVLTKDVEDVLSTANHLSIYGTGYGPEGMHKIHRDTSGNDGAVVLDPLSGTSTYLLFRFADQSF